MRLGILTSHPIQYQAPWFRGLAKELDLEVFFCHYQSAKEQGEAGFGLEFEWDVDLLSSYKYRFLNNVAARPGVNRFAGCDTPEIREVIANRKFDAFIVSGWNLKSYWQAVRACRHSGVPVMVRGDSQLLTPRSWWKRWAKEICYRWLLRQFDGFLVVGQRNREYLAHYGVPHKKMFLAPHFVDNSWFREKADSLKCQRKEIRKQWGAGEKTLVALYVGKFQAIKRPGDLLWALAEAKARVNQPVGQAAKQRIPNMLAVFVGSGAMETRMRADAAVLGVDAHFAGFKNQSELPGYYVAADVLVLPSESETWGLVVNEGMACGLPAIVSDMVGCAPDLICEGKTGFTYPVGDTVALASRLQQICEMLGEGINFAQGLREKLQTYSVQTTIGETKRAVSALVNCDRR